MKRITITFYPEIMEQLEKRVEEKKLQTVSQCIRELVELGLKIEAAASQKTNENDFDNEEVLLLNDIKKLLKHNLTWSMESRLLDRFIVENQLNLSETKTRELLDTYKEKAQAHVSGLFDESID